MNVIKRDGNIVEFNKNKIVSAIKKAMNSSTGVYEENLAE
ncbi:MAG: ATP cone domain-containing protein, partial [Miniphocaeibacter sp.]